MFFLLFKCCETFYGTYIVFTLTFKGPNKWKLKPEKVRVELVIFNILKWRCFNWIPYEILLIHGLGLKVSLYNDSYIDNREWIGKAIHSKHLYKYNCYQDHKRGGLLMNHIAINVASLLHSFFIVFIIKFSVTNSFATDIDKFLCIK